MARAIPPQLDLELHWCLDSGTKGGHLGRKIIAALAKLRTHYHVICRVAAIKNQIGTYTLVTETTGAPTELNPVSPELQKKPFRGAGGCHTPSYVGAYNMVSISYLNKNVYT